MQSVNRFKVLVAGLALLASGAHAQVKIGVVVSTTGPVALVGIPQKNTVPLLPTNAGGQSIEYIVLDDASDPTATVTAVRKLIGEHQVDALIGPSGSPNAMGVLQFAAEAQVPLLAGVGTAAVVQPMDAQKQWVFKPSQNDEIIAAGLVEHMAAEGVRRVGFIGSADAYGDNWLKVFRGIAQQRGIAVSSAERFLRQDTTVMAQALKLSADRPDAVLIAAPGAAAVLPQTTLHEVGYRGRYYQTHGAAFPGFLKLGGRKVEGTVLAVSGLLVADQLPDTSPIKPQAMKYTAAYQARYGDKPALFGAGVFDAGLLLQAAIPAALKGGAKPGTPAFRKALRDALEQVKGLPGTQGVFTMTPTDHSGFDEKGRSLVTVKNGQWTWVR